jgi:photosystem II stability/assembly factor-like uncharacterized protein
MALNDTYLTNDFGSIFIQADGVGPTDLSWLGCHDLGDIEQPLGDIERTFCPNPAGRGLWDIATRTQTPPGEVTFDIEVKLGKLADKLEVAARKRCPIPVYVVDNYCIARNQFSPFDRATVIAEAIVTSITQSNIAGANSDGGNPPSAMKTFSFSALTTFDAFSLGYARRTTAETEALLDIAICNIPQCAGACGGSVDDCENMYTVAAAGAAAIAHSYYSNDSGGTWTATAADPFIADEDISSTVCFDLDDGTTRWLVVRGTNPHEVAYSDDEGATWTLVAVGATVAEFSPWNGGLFALDGRHIWCCTDTGAGAAGEVYFSSDFGVTWVAQAAAGTDAFNTIKFINERVGVVIGDTNEIRVTTDGGEHWAAITGPAAQAAVNAMGLGLLSESRMYITYDDGEIWFTDDGGTSWTQVTMPGIPGETWVAVNDMCAMDEHVLWAVGYVNDGANDSGVVIRSISGGENWEYWQADTDCDSGVGFNSIACCAVNHAFAVGCPETTAWIMEVVES